jgi:DNA invertase Pin-like site-specific DNA recombinase
MSIYQSGPGNYGKTEEETEKKKDEVLKLVQQGKMATKISREAGVSDGTVKRWTEEAGEVLVTKNARDIFKKKVIELAK